MKLEFVLDETMAEAIEVADEAFQVNVIFGFFPQLGFKSAKN